MASINLVIRKADGTACSDQMHIDAIKADGSVYASWMGSSSITIGIAAGVVVSLKFTRQTDGANWQSPLMYTNNPDTQADKIHVAVPVF